MTTPAQVFSVACLIVLVGFALTVLTWRLQQWLRCTLITARHNREVRQLRRMVRAEEALFLPFEAAGLTPDQHTPLHDSVVVDLAARRRPTGGAA